jgi:hypothetical protein
MKKPSKTKLGINPATDRDYPYRLAELETEIRPYPSRPAGERPLKSVEKPEEIVIGRENVVQFRLRENVFAAGHTDVTYAGSNHARGVRHIRFYVEGKTVLDIEGDFEDQQFGSNFRFQNIDLYAPGAWEAEFVKLTDELSLYKAKRKAASTKKRLAEQTRRNRA